MPRSLLSLLLAAVVAGCASTPPEPFDLYAYSDYEVTCDMVGTEGVQTMVVASFGDDVTDALVKARYNAVHALLFKGLRTSVCSAPPLVDAAAYRASEPWFADLFSASGAYGAYVVTAGDVPLDVVYVDGGVKVFSQVSVSRNDLRAALDDAGVVSGLGDVFDRSARD